MCPHRPLCARSLWPRAQVRHIGNRTGLQRHDRGEPPGVSHSQLFTITAPMQKLEMETGFHVSMATSVKTTGFLINFKINSWRFDDGCHLCLCCVLSLALGRHSDSSSPSGLSGRNQNTRYCSSPRPRLESQTGDSDVKLYLHEGAE